MSSEHKRGWEGSNDSRSIERKNRAKAKHFGLDGRDGNVNTPEDFWVKKETTSGSFGVIANNTFGKLRVFYQDEEVNCSLDPKLPISLANQIMVGDYALLHSENNNNYITNLVGRGTVLSRVRRDSTRFGPPRPEDEQIIAANVDAAVIVASVRNPSIKPSFIDRYLVLIQRNNIEPIIVFNKSDLGNEGEDLEEYYSSIGLKVIRTSAELGLGIDKLKDTIKGKTIVFVGQSGVGKSSLVNSVIGESARKVGEVAEKNGHGRHTTTDSALLIWDEKSMIIDTPGIKSLEILEIPKEELQYYYSDINQFRENCKFSDCLHWQEPEDKCAVKKAIKEGLLSKKRYESYLRILKEL